MKSTLLFLFSTFLALNFSDTFAQNNALDFDGSNDFVEVNNASSLISTNSPMSMSAWVYPTNTASSFPNFDGFLGFRNDNNADFYLLQLGSTNVEARFTNSAGNTFTAVQPGLVLNTWQHFVLTYNGFTLSVYLNGVLGVSIPANGNLTNPTVDFMLGKVNFGSGDFFFDGKLDEVGLWSKSLSVAEVTCMYEEGLDPTDANLELYFDLNQGVANAANAGITSVTDQMNNINGVLNSASLIGPSSNWVDGVASHTQILANICSGTTYAFAGQNLSTAGVYYDLIPLTSGCDSIVALTLTVDNVSGTDTRSECPPFTWIDGNVYTSNNNTASFNIVGGAGGGCDSLVNLDLTIVTQASGTDVITTCNSITWIDGNAYNTNNNTATFLIVGGAASGCDSLVTLNLTVSALTGTDAITSCSAITWINGTTYAGSNSTAKHTIVGGGAGGCDSIVSLNLTITPSAFGTDVQTACGALTWLNGSTYASNNNTATHTITGGAASGCDSLVTLNLTIINPAAGVDAQTACPPYTWLDGNTYTTSNNNATFNVVNGAANGCDSLVTLNLTILQPATKTDKHSACGAFVWIDGNTYNTSNNSAVFTITGGAANGCDSIVTLDLTVTILNTSVTQNINTLSSMMTGVSYQWLNCTEDFDEVSGATDSSFTASSNGTYALEISENGCIDTSACFTVSSVGILNNSFAQEVLVYPNPTQDKLTVDLGESFTKIAIEVYNHTGQLVISNSYENTELISVDLENQTAGIYFIRLFDEENKSVLMKVVKR